MLRVDIADLPPELAERIAAGEEVVFERNGHAIATLAPRPDRKRKRGAVRLWAALAALPPLDSSYERDIAALDEVVRPQVYKGWE